MGASDRLMAASVEFIGLRETARAFRELEPKTRKALPKQLKAVADMVAAEARNRMPSRSGRASSSVRGASTASSAAVVGGKGRVPYFAWLDFGSREPRTGNTRAEGPWRGSGQGPKAGRFIYPAIESKRTEIESATLDAVEAAAREVGFH
jgi:hypothetical protein